MGMLYGKLIDLTLVFNKVYNQYHADILKCFDLVHMVVSVHDSIIDSLTVHLGINFCEYLVDENK